jgi:hypothetical protein
MCIVEMGQKEDPETPGKSSVYRCKHSVYKQDFLENSPENSQEECWAIGIE